MYLIISFLAGINLMNRTCCFYQSFIVASKTISKTSVSLMFSVGGSEIKIHNPSP